MANSFFIATISLSDSLLIFIADENATNEYSGFAWGWGYLGGIVCLVAVMAIQVFTSEFSPFTFLFVGVFYLGVSLYSLQGLKGQSNIFRAEKEDSQTKEKIHWFTKVILLFGYWLISESITVVILFFAIYASEELKLESKIIGVVLLGVQIIGIFTTWYGGKLADKHGSLRLLGVSILGWIAVLILLIETNSYKSLILITIITGLVIGNSQSFLRSQFSKVVNKYEAGFQFGFFSIASQAAVIIGPALYGYLSDYLGSQQTPLWFTVGFLVVGYTFVVVALKKINLSNAV